MRLLSNLVKLPLWMTVLGAAHSAKELYLPAIIIVLFGAIMFALSEALNNYFCKYRFALVTGAFLTAVMATQLLFKAPPLAITAIVVSYIVYYYRFRITATA